jgi:TolB-like protein
MAERNAAVPEGKRLEFRIGVNLGDIILDDGDIFGDGVNIAARLEALAEPGGICLGGAAHEQVRDKLDLGFEDMGEQQVKNITRPVRVYRIPLQAKAKATTPEAAPPAPPLPDKPSIAVLPFTNMSGDPEQEYFVDGMVEEIITALSRIRWLFVLAGNSSFTYKGQAVDVKQVSRELGVRYVLEGSVRKAGGRVRITGRRDQRGASLGRPLRRFARRCLRPPGQGGVERRRRDRAGVTSCRNCSFGRPTNQRSDRLRPLFARLCDGLVVGKANPRGATSSGAGDRARSALRAGPRLGRELLPSACRRRSE